MTLLRIPPVIISSILISAHFMRGGYSVAAVLCLLTPALLLFNRTWAIRTVQTLLVLFAIEWSRTLFHLVQVRMEYEMPWMRLAVILGVVVLFTLASGFWLRSPLSPLSSRDTSSEGNTLGAGRSELD